jgi:hypothetical protein
MQLLSIRRVTAAPTGVMWGSTRVVAHIDPDPMEAPPGRCAECRVHRRAWL